jgi:RNA polymerase sigma-70 factor, ECF subfamily
MHRPRQPADSDAPDAFVTDEALMLDVRRGSRAAFEVLFDRYRDPVWRFFRRRVDDSARAEELVQDVFVAILQNAVRYEPRAAFRSYLFSIAFNALKADRRKAVSRKVAHLADEPPAVLPDPDDTIWVRRALATLDSDHRDMLMLREYEQLSYQEIAELLRIPVNTVRSRLFRARTDLKHALSNVPAGQ